MKKFTQFFAGATCLFFASRLLADPGPMDIWFTTPSTPGDSTSWQQWALPVGNGKLAAMVYGGIGSEQIQFNEDTIWGGEPHGYGNPNASPLQLGLIRNNCFNFTPDTTMTSLETSYLIGTPIQHAAYQPAGMLVLNFPQSTGTSNYLRSLDLNTATVNVHYDYDGVTYSRDIFASAPSNHVIAVHFYASQPDRVTFSCSFNTLQTASYYTTGNDLVMHASVSAYSNSSYGLANLVQYDARVRLIATGGTVSTTSSSISVTNADDVVLLLGVASNFTNYNALDLNTNDCVTVCSNHVAAAAALGFTALRQAQTNDYQNLFNRVVLDLGGNARTNWDIGSRKQQMAIDGDDPQLVALDFQLGRYLMISGSRPGSQPLNLQGKWNDLTSPSWRSEMTLNINEEMNYWGAEECNLSECALPLFDMMQDLSVTGHAIATNTYFLSGTTYSNAWVVHHDTDLWRGAAPCNGIDGVWPTGAAWLCQHVWWHYLYTGDTNWLATNGYPLMKGAAQFFRGFLITNGYPKNASWPANYTNWLVTNPSYSPEQQLSNSISTVASPTVDNDLLRDLFSHVMAACQVLNTDAAFSVTCSNLMAQLPPDQVGTSAQGQLQEWLQDYEVESRHCSHLVGFFPGDEISTFYTPALAAAAKRSIDLRGYDTTPPWSSSWRINLRTRLQDGDGAWTNLLFLYSSAAKVSTNLVFADTPNRQLDSIFGRMSGIATMFLQSPRGELILLPALPSQLSSSGRVSGLCAAGGFEVDNMTWTNGQLSGATILSKLGNVCNLRSRWPIIVMQGSSVVSAPMVLPGLYQFATIAGSNYTILPATIAEVENLSATTSGASQQIITNAAFSNWRAAQFNATAVGNSVTYLVANVAAGTYHLYVTANAGPNCGQFQLASGPSGGALTNIGSVQDTYSPTNVVYLLPIKLTTTTNVIVLWTNMQREFDCGNWTAPSNGNYNFQLTVAGKNAGSSGYVLTPDYIKFAPAVIVPPLTPTNLTATAGNGQVSLSWTASLWAAGYIVERSTTNNGPYTSIVTNTATSYVDTSVTNGMTYYYVVAALNGVGESGNSTQASATPQFSSPAAPTGLNATAGNAQVSLSWNTSPGATGYNVKRSTVNNGPYTNIAASLTTSYMDTGLTNGTTYYYVVSATNAAGESANSSQAGATPQIPAPTGLTAVAGNGQVSLSWTASAGASGYIVGRSTINNGPYTGIVTNSTTSYVDTNVVNGTTYYYVIVAVATGAQSPNSSQASATPLGASVTGLFLYEGFNYTNAIDLTNNGGTGWTYAWNDKTALTVINAAGLGYTDGTGNVLQTSGGSITLTNLTTADTIEPERLLGGATTVTLGTLAATNSGTLWLSLLWQGLNTGGQGTDNNSYRQATMQFYAGATTTAGSGSEYLDLGMPNINNNGIPRTFSLWDDNVISGGTTVSSTAPLQSTVAANTDSTIFVLVQMTIDNSTTTPDTINVWLNPPLGVDVGGLGTPNLTFSGQDLSAINAIRFQSSAVNSTYNVGGQMTVDEFRLGNSPASVTPYVPANTAPVLSPLPNQTINVGVNLLITNTATDASVPAQTLTFSLPTAPTNATLGASSGILNWRPLVTQADTTNPFSVVVTGNGTPNLSATQSFSITVNPLSLPGVAAAAILPGGQFGFSVNGQIGPDYAVQGSTNFLDWDTLFITNPAAMPFTWSATNTTVFPAQFYRIKLGPPLP